MIPGRGENYSDEDDHDDAWKEGFISWSLPKLALHCRGVLVMSRTSGPLLSSRELAVYVVSAGMNQQMHYPTHELKLVGSYVKSIGVFVSLLQIMSRKFMFDVMF